MNFSEFMRKCQDYPFIRSNRFPLMTDNPSVLRRQVTEWLKKKWLLELKRGVYIIADIAKRGPASNVFLANYLLAPSYISLETALSHYRLIPERVEAITSITPKKTQRYQNSLGHFIYHHIKQPSYKLFVAELDEFGRQYYIATPEKALVDYLYFHSASIKKLSKDYFHDSLRLQNTERLSSEKLLIAAECFQQKKLTSSVETLIDFLGELS
ncbi:MAG: hypothetical protein NTW08_04090 [Gammaproteobacteria bacterium]|nr:hypothetical protein [Gammaproteobacteria bacterium]